MKKQPPTTKSNKRLVLTHSRVRRLEGGDLADVNGGAGCNPSCVDSCKFVSVGCGGQTKPDV